jgi:hypothetical protein
MSDRQLPEGHLSSWDLHVEHDPAPDAGTFTGGGWKLVWHTTEGTNLRTMVRVLRDKNAAPHLVVGRDPSDDHFTAVQMVPFDVAARALEHPSGPDTNRANAIQVEVCEFAKNAADFNDGLMAALAAVACLVEHRVEIPRTAPRAFSSTPDRYTGWGFVRAKGHLGHQHVANQPSNHWDPGRFPVRKLFSLMDKIDH